MRPAILTALALLTLTACKPAPPAPSFPITEVVAPEPSPDDAPQFVETPAKPVSVPAKTPAPPAGYECRDGVCGPRADSESGPVRRVFSRLPVVRRFGR